MRYNPSASYGKILRDKCHPSEIAGHRPMMAPRIVNELSAEDEEYYGPLESLRGQPGELYADESYHEGTNVEKFNRELRSGLGTGRPDNTDE